MPLQDDPARYVAYTFYDWLEDDYFRQWVRTPSLQSDAFFNALRLCYPEKEKDITVACMLLRILSRPKVDALSAAEAQALWHRIKRSMDQEEPSVSRS
jgi:hypothetical protein